MPDIQRIIDDFDVLDDWDDRYRYIIELGRDLEPMPADGHNEANRVKGCASQVWLDTRPTEGGALHFVGDSDAHIVKGLIAITLALFSGHRPAEILARDAGDTFRRLGLSEHLTPQRSNGVRAMVERIKADAQAAQASTPVVGQA
ncbi:SufE family protein [Lichenihabitans sp. Uapishka_5]|uniref:SufE family protein n=1 Tax=Lichenihabitans sp. Uapishka_5 TaxID=3037302 RepID=UPI0029E7DE0E|nr:SufE family protein [Lichenihabitans sp. Uapishka_5]MDX7953627.1 SufE family protein [Lichenihabitans sp. Uapishka_5]